MNNTKDFIKIRFKNKKINYDKSLNSDVIEQDNKCYKEFFEKLKNNHNKYKDNIEFINDYLYTYKNCSESDIKHISNFGSLDSKYPACLNNTKMIGYSNSIVLRSGEPFN